VAIRKSVPLLATEEIPENGESVVAGAPMACSPRRSVGIEFCAAADVARVMLRRMQPTILISVSYVKRDDRVHGFAKQSDPSHVFGMRPWALFLYQQNVRAA
jgi:hypothetical protein